MTICPFHYNPVCSPEGTQQYAYPFGNASEDPLFLFLSLRVNAQLPSGYRTLQDYKRASFGTSTAAYYTTHSQKITIWTPQKVVCKEIRTRSQRCF